MLNVPTDKVVDFRIKVLWMDYHISLHMYLADNIFKTHKHINSLVRKSFRLYCSYIILRFHYWEKQMFYKDIKCLPCKIGCSFAPYEITSLNMYICSLLTLLYHQIKELMNTECFKQQHNCLCSINMHTWCLHTFTHRNSSTTSTGYTLPDV